MLTINCPSFLPPLIDFVPIATPLRPSRADDEGREVLLSVPISGRSAPSAASRQQSLSSYPAGRARLSYSTRLSSASFEICIASFDEPRSLPILLHLRPLQRKRVRECFLVIRIEIRQLLHFLGCSRQQKRSIRLFVWRIDAFSSMRALSQLALKNAICIESCPSSTRAIECRGKNARDETRLPAVVLGKKSINHDPPNRIRWASNSLDFSSSPPSP